MSPSQAVRLAQHFDRPGHTPPPEEDHATRRQGLPLRRHDKARRQLPQPQAPPMLCRGLASQTRVDMLRVDGLLQSCQLPTQIAGPVETPLEQRFLEPAVEVLHAAVALGFPSRDEYRADAEVQAEANHP